MNPFADEQGYLWCPCCEKQIPASLWCDRCNSFAHEHPPAVSLEEWVFDQSPDRKWPRIAA